MLVMAFPSLLTERGKLAVTEFKAPRAQLNALLWFSRTHTSTIFTENIIRDKMRVEFGFRSVVAKDTTMSVVVKLARETEEQAPDDVRFVNRYAAKFNVVNWPIRCDQSEGTPCHGGANI